ncbi:glutamyl aminopeptidase-like [Nylanderia fulva]|uniref:glutamyl aminopeptidase-like n=1 Tax=Nylanderia fulva TaxID=613905 RepID=UPI0010FB6F25|nr:glutamyl aminopeptidase-like [Nylanderia fulva]
MAATRFHKIGARQIFPCWNGPELKATFRIVIKHRLQHMVLSNMPVDKTDIISFNTVCTTFKVTPRISTHLVAFMVFDLILTNVKYYPKILSPFYLIFAQYISYEIIYNVKLMWHIPTDVKEMQQVAIPNFPHNAMVNWGTNFYRLSDIIYEEEKDPVMRKIEVARLLAHKILQQFLSNLVSPSSSSLWLNEGIPMMLGIQILDKILQKSSIMDLFTIQYRYESLHLDCGLLKPLTSKSNTSEINSIFSYPYYAKAFTILNIMRNMFSNYVIQYGIEIYFQNYKYKTASLDNFWSAMETAYNKYRNDSDEYINLSRIMNPWTTQLQYCVLKIKQLNYRDPKKIIISLENFNEPQLETDWWIPVIIHTTNELWGSFTIYNSSTFRRLSSKPMMIKYPVEYNEKDIIKELLNLSFKGYFRVNYDNLIWNRIIHLLVPQDLKNSHKQIELPALIKANLIDDAFHFMQAGQLDRKIFWNVLNILKAEVEYIAWYPMFKVFEYISRVMPLYSNRVDEIKENVQNLFSVITINIDFKEYRIDDDLTKCLKQEIARWACVFDYDTCINEANKELTMHFDSPSTNRILPWWKTWTFCHGIGNNYSMWSNVLHLWLESSDAKESSRILEFLCCTKNEAAIKLMLRKGDDQNLSERNIFSSLQVRDHIKMFSLLITKHAQNYKVLDYILSNFEKLKPREISIAAALIIIINHVYSVMGLDYQIDQFVFKNLYTNELYYKITQKMGIRSEQIKRLLDDLDFL